MGSGLDDPCATWRTRIQPVGHLHEERVAQVLLKEPVYVVVKVEVAAAGPLVVVRSSLLPHDKDRRSRPILPRQHAVRSLLELVEVVRLQIGLRAIGLVTLIAIGWSLIV